jgi:hypothetical protein
VSNQVVAFYPGGGGNRYLRKLLGAEYTTEGIAYDNRFRNQSFEHRYLIGNVLPPSTNITLTHCMDVDRIQEKLKTDQVLIIKTDLFKSLRREWMLNGHKLYANQHTEDRAHTIVELYNTIKTPTWPVCNTYAEFALLEDRYQQEVINLIPVVPVELHSAWSTITWHLDYYENTNTKAATIIDDPEFMSIIEAELDRYRHPIFEFCWEQYNMHGANAPIVDLYNQHILEPSSRK